LLFSKILTYLIKATARALIETGIALETIRQNTYTEHSISLRIIYILLNKNALKTGDQIKAFRNISIKGSKRGPTWPALLKGFKIKLKRKLIYRKYQLRIRMQL